MSKWISIQQFFSWRVLLKWNVIHTHAHIYTYVYHWSSLGITAESRKISYSPSVHSNTSFGHDMTWHKLNGHPAGTANSTWIYFLQKGIHKQYIIWCNSTWQGHTHPQSHTFPWLFCFSSGDCTAVSEPFCQSHTAESRHTRGRGGTIYILSYNIALIGPLHLTASAVMMLLSL